MCLLSHFRLIVTHMTADSELLLKYDYYSCVYLFVSFLNLLVYLFTLCGVHIVPVRKQAIHKKFSY